MAKERHLSDGAQLYLGTVISAGVVAVVHSLYVLQLHPVSYHWLLLAGLTLLSGSFTIRISTIPARLSVSETFVFATVLLFGPAAATMIVVLDSLVISLWLKQRSRSAARVLFNVAAPSIAIWFEAHAFYALAGIEPLSTAPRPILTLVGPLSALAVLYFLLNSSLVAAAVAFEKHVSALSVWRNNFLWLSLNYFSGASVAALLLPYLQPEKPEFARVIGILLPLLLISYLTFKTAMGRVDDANRHLRELNRLYLSTIETLAMAIDAKDQITHGHIRRVQVQAVTLAKGMGVTDDVQIQAIEAAALLHDMGKLAIPEYILNKPGALTTAEFEKMKLHASVGADILSAINFPYPVVPIVRHHHENWDGTGYPDSLAGSSIPIGARILSVVDCFDALTSDRPYRPRLSEADALTILKERRGRMYDPLVVDSFLKLHEHGGLGTPEPRSAVPLATALKTVATSRTSAADDKTRLEEISASGEEMLVLLDLARGLSSAAALSDAGAEIVKHLRRIVPSSLLVFYKHEVDTNELSASFSSGEHSDLVGGLRIPLGQRLSGWVAANRRTIRNSDAVLDFGESARAITPRLRSCLSTPVAVGDSLVGVVSLYSTVSDGFSEDHQRVLEAVAKQVAPVLEQIISNSRTKDFTLRAHWLGVSNGTHIDSRPAIARMPAPSMSLLYIRVHRSGGIQNPERVLAFDQVLAHVSSSVRGHSRESDVLVRYDSDDFLVLQPHTERVAAEDIAARIRSAIGSDTFNRALSSDVRVTIGVSSMPEDGQSIQALVAVAQQRSTAVEPPRNDQAGPHRGSIH